MKKLSALQKKLFYMPTKIALAILLILLSPACSKSSDSSYALLSNLPSQFIGTWKNDTSLITISSDSIKLPTRSIKSGNEELIIFDPAPSYMHVLIISLYINYGSTDDLSYTTTILCLYNGETVPEKEMYTATYSMEDDELSEKEIDTAAKCPSLAKDGLTGPFIRLENTE